MIWNKIIITAIGIATMLATGTAQSNVQNSDIYTGSAEITATNQVRLLPGFRAAEGCNVNVYIDPSASYTPVVYNPTPGGAPGTVSASGSMNYIRTTVLRQEQTNEANIGSSQRSETVNYFDGLGRPVQSIAVQASPLKKDIIQALAYDGFGRDSIHYLPYMSGTTTGAYVSNPETGCANFYSSAVPGRESGTSPWNETLYEQSPLNRVTGGKGPDDWQQEPTTIGYLTNTTAVNNWTASGTPATYTGSNFTANQLYVTQYTDEDGNQTREYKDKLGRVVCKAANDGTNWLNTHYIYDEFGLLRCVVPPKASGPADTELCYYYEYDKRRRMTKKDLPGAAPVYMVYDKRDRLVMVQDGNLASTGDWRFTKYDALNRPVLTGIIHISKTQLQAATDFANFSGTMYETLSGNVFGYTNISFPSAYNLLISESNVYTVTYYDGYSFISDAAYNYTTPHLAGNPANKSTKTKGLVTGTITRVLENVNDNIDDDLLQTVNYYDNYGRIIRTIADNHMNGKDIVYNNYNFANEVTETVVRHNVSGTTQEVKLATTYAYDHQGRLLTEKMKINDGTEITLSSYKYNELGEQIAKYLHGSSSGSDFNQKVDYVYNIKGWLRKQNQTTSLGTDLFAQELKYQDSGNPSSYFNGNIWQTGWRNSGDIAKNYTFSYDEINRLEDAVYSDGVNNGDFDTGYAYDANGNISTLSRKASGNPIDVLTYSYLNGGNRLQTVTDAGTTEGYHAVGGNYGYDVNGNMTTDPSKGTTIEYNYLNLPAQVQFGANDNLRYTYDAAGNKLAKVVDGTVAGNNTRLDYSGNFVYENDELKAIFTSAGRIIPFDNNGNIVYKFEYNLQDHLGNTRVVFSGHSNGQPEVMQVTDYYPFGLVMNQQDYFANGVLSNKYLYNNKELQDDELAGNSLGWYDYGARFYDPALARWHSVDPRADKYFSNSPYNYCVNNPMLYVDPQGDTINISQAMLNDEQAMAAHNEWKTSRAGNRFYKRYGVGGKHENVSVNLDISSDGDATGGTSTFAVDKETGKETRIYPSRSLEAMKKEGLNIDGKRSSLLKGEYLKFNVTFDPPSKYNTSELQSRWNIRKGLTILHETQHVRMMHNDILNYGYMYYSGFDQHYFMKDTKLEHFQERFNYYREKQPGYSNEKINKIINNFEYGRF